MGRCRIPLWVQDADEGCRMQSGVQELSRGAGSICGVQLQPGMQDPYRRCRSHLGDAGSIRGMQDPFRGPGSLWGSLRHRAHAALPPRAVKSSLSLLCAELRGDPEPKKKRSKLSEAAFSSIKGSPVSPASPPVTPIPVLGECQPHPNFPVPRRRRCGARRAARRASWPARWLTRCRS